MTENRNVYEQWLDFDSSELKVRIVAFSNFDKIELIGPKFTMKLLTNTNEEGRPDRGDSIWELIHTLTKAASCVEMYGDNEQSTDEEELQPEAEGV